MANTTWNPADKGVNLSLSNLNLTATTAIGTNIWVRAVHAQTAGKYYWETTFTTTTSSSTGIGIATATANLSGGFTVGAAVGSCAVVRVGNIYIDGTIVSGGITIGTVLNGTAIGIAWDATARLIWFRQGAAGNWNGNVANNPATGVGGRASSPATGLAYPAFSSGAASEVITANFGDTAFTGVVPAGFTAGFPTVPGGGGGTAQAMAMVLA